jgi:hypothetical protein
VTKPVCYQCHLVFSSLVSSSRCQDLTRSATTLPPSPHRLVGKLLVGSCLGTMVPPPSTLTMSPGPTMLSQCNNCCRLPLPIVACPRCPSHVAASSSPSQGRLATTTRRCGHFTLVLSPRPLLTHPFPSLRLSVGWPKWFSDIHVILERS